MMSLAEDDGLAIVEVGVPRTQQTMPPDRVFWSHFSPNLGTGSWILGLLLVPAGLDFRMGLLAIVLGNLIGALPVGFAALMGPITGLTQIETSRFTFGVIGKRIPAAVNYLMCVGFSASGAIPGSLALQALLGLAHVVVPFWICLIVMQSTTLIAGFYGHHLVQLMQKYLGYFLLAAFTIVGVMAALHVPGAAFAPHAVSAASFALGVSLMASNAISWTPYSSDYTRYLPPATPPRIVFGLSYGALVSSCIAVETLGLITAVVIHDTSPVGFMAGVARISGGFAWAAFAALVSSVLVGNAINDTTASYSLISTGLRIPRRRSAIVTGVVIFAIAMFGVGRFTTLYMQFLFLVLYWVAPWAGVLLADRRHIVESRDVTERWRKGVPIFLVTTIATIALFSSTDIYQSPVAKLLGGVDIGYFIGFFAAYFWYKAAYQGETVPDHIVPGIWFEPPVPEPDASFERLKSEIALAPEVVDLGSGPFVENRSVAWYGDDGAIYRYAGTHNIPNPWTPELARLRTHLEAALGVRLNSCLVGWYENGANDVNWHADDEPELRGCIVSVSLGATRTFKIRPSTGGSEIDIPLEHGSVLVMTVESQQSWWHSVPAEPASGPRMNLTFREIALA
jgi:NCS1 family nucleobase:cation symporter-1